MSGYRARLLLVPAALGVVIATAGAVSALGSVRIVDVISIVAGSFGAGAALVAALHARKAAKRRR